MVWDADCQRLEAALRTRGVGEPDPPWNLLRETWVERLDRAHALRRAAMDAPTPLLSFERVAVWLSAFHDSAVADLVLEVGLTGREAEREWLEPALAALLFADQIAPTVRPWELVPTGDAAAIERAYDAIERGSVLMGSPLVFADERSLWVLWEGSLRCAYGELDQLIVALESA